MVLFAVSRGQTKPGGNKLPRIDWTHPLANSLLHYGWDTGGLSGLGATAAQNVIDLVTGWTFYTMGQPLNYPVAQGTPYGVGMVYNSNISNNLTSTASIQAATAAGNYTFASAFIQTSNPPSDSQPFVRTANNNASAPYINWGLDINASGAGTNQIRAGVNNSGAYASTPNATFGGNNTFTTAVGTLAGGAGTSTLTLYLNGAATTSVGSITPASVNTNDVIGYGTTSSAGTQNSFNGLVFYGAFWGRVLSAPETLQLHLDPYCFLLFDLDEIPSVPRSGTQAQLTQIAIEQWAQGSPAAQLTQVAIEQWASLAIAPPTGRAYMTSGTRAGLSAALWSTTTRSYMVPVSAALAEAPAPAPIGPVGGGAQARVMVLA